MVVRHSTGSYEIAFLSLSEALIRLPEDSIVVTDENVFAAWSHVLGSRGRTVVVPPGESSKSMEQFGSVLSEVSRRGALRRTAIVAVGGGVVGDLAGFVAASYMRGVPFIQIPTSLLAQVDSAVGGKVGIDLPEGKNLVGAFHQPQAVYLPLETLSTLPEREFTNGMAEVCKYGFIMDSALYATLGRALVTPGSTDLEDIVLRCLELKAQVVEEDEFETTGRRAILNFGHTVGHAIEAHLGYGRILHGEAIAIGMTIEAELGEGLGITERGTSEAVRALLQLQGLPTHLDTNVNPSDLLPFMRKDKKGDSKGLAFSFLTRIGECKLVKGVDEREVLTAFGPR